MSKHVHEEEINKLAQLRGLLLDDFLRLSKSGELTPTDRRTLAGLLKDNNMLLDPSDLPQHLRDKLTQIPVDQDIEKDVQI